MLLAGPGGLRVLAWGTLMGSRSKPAPRPWPTLPHVCTCSPARAVLPLRSGDYQQMSVTLPEYGDTIFIKMHKEVDGRW